MISAIAPIDITQQSVVINRTQLYIDKASAYFDFQFQPVEVRFDLKGKAAGMYCLSNRPRGGLRNKLGNVLHDGQAVIRYNPYIFSKYFEDNLANTVPHEVAHHVVSSYYGVHKIRPHGAQWNDVMRYFGASPSRTCDYDLSGIPVRQYQKILYQCGCMEHSLTKRRHNQIVNNKKQYFCRKCQSPLVRVSTIENNQT